MKRLPWLASTSVLLLASVAGTAASTQQTPISLDTVRVDVTSRAARALGTSTRSVDVLDRELILRSPATTVVEMLQWGFGVELMPRSPALVDVGIRGSSFEQVLVLVDGVRMRDGQTGHFNLNLAVPLDQVERIEILRGPAASLYGSDAMAGVINIVTRGEGESSAASVSAGSFDRRSLALSHRRTVGGISADLAGAFDRSDGHRPGTDFEMGTGRLALQVPLAEHSISAEVAHAVREFGADGFYGDYPAFETTRTTTALASAHLQPSSRFSIDPALRMRRNSDDFILFRDEPDRYRNQHSTVQIGGDLIGRLAFSDNIRAAAGLHAFQDRVRSAALGDHDEVTAAASLEVAAERPGVAIATAGLRADRVPTGEVVLAPGLSAAWWPTSSVRLRTSGGHAFRSPTWTERFYRDPMNEGSASLLAERAWSVDAGVDLYPLTFVRLSASAFSRNASDLIDWARPSDGSDPVWRTRNVSEAHFKGFEAEIELGRIAGTRLRAQGSWLSLTSSAAPGFESKYALRPQTESMAISADRDFFGFVELFARAARERRVGETGHLKIDSRAAVRLRDVRLFFDLQNATDAEYLDISQYPAAGRTVGIGLELRQSSR